MSVLGGTKFKMRSDTANDPYAAVQFAALADYTAGQMIKLNDTVGVIPRTTLTGYQSVLIYRATRIVVPCVVVTSGNLGDLAIGSKVYFDTTNAEVTSVAGGNVLCGTVHVAPAVGDETILIDLDGRLGIVS